MTFRVKLSNAIAGVALVSPLVRICAFNVAGAGFAFELAPRRVLLRGSVGAARTARTFSSTHTGAESPADSCGTEFAARSVACAPNPSDAERAGAWKRTAVPSPSQRQLR